MLLVKLKLMALTSVFFNIMRASWENKEFWTFLLGLISIVDVLLLLLLMLGA